MNKGAAAILLTVLISSVILLIAGGLSFLALNELKLSREIAESIPAFYSAEAGAEECLYKIRKETDCAAGSTGVLTSGATWVIGRPSNNILTSFGTFRETNRKIELSW